MSRGRKEVKFGFEDMDESLLRLNCGSDFDPAIKYGRDDLLFVKREYLDEVKGEMEEKMVKKLKDEYVRFTEPGRGLTFSRFCDLMIERFNNESHPYFP